MEAEKIVINPIGIIHTPFSDINDMPIQPMAAKGIKGYIELYPEYVDGLTDLSGFSHITLIYHFHKNSGYQLRVKPFMDEVEHGIFATRSPKRPNAIGLSTVKLLKMENNIIHIEMADMLDGTPLIDIKPFFEHFDNCFNTKTGWLTPKKIGNKNLRSDERFKD